MTLNLMVQGTTSDAGKSTLVCALGRALTRQKIAVAPFKPQNMALNSAVTIDGGEIGRAQALQAQACHLQPITDFNPVLLKPNNDIGCQVIINGKVADTLSATAYHNYKPTAMKAVLEAHQRLEKSFDYILIEGAGSPAEINLRDRDIANMGFAEAVDCPVILIADIDRGGVFAHLLGTLQCLSESERNRVVGFVINRFRGDLSLLTSGLEWLEEKTGKPVLGVLPYVHGLYLDSEDAVQQQSTLNDANNQHKILNVVVPVYPRTSNHNDFDALRAHPNINIQFIGPHLQENTSNGQHIPPADLVILPGSKNTIADLRWLKQQGWQPYLEKHLRYGGKLIGICGGLQMLGELIQDPKAIENKSPTEETGFGWLPIQTELLTDKTLELKQGFLALPNQPTVEMQGYEIHAGLTEINQQSISHPVHDEQDAILKNGGILSSDQKIFASYWHGLFDTPDALNALLKWAGANHDIEQFSYQATREIMIDRLADEVEQHMDMNQLQTIVEGFYNKKKK